MFGIDFGSFIIILIVAIIFLGPDKLPEMIIQIVKFIKSFKSTVQEAKDTIQKEIDIHDLKNTALSYKEKVEELTKDINNPVNMYNNKEVSDVFSDISKDFKDIEENIKKELDSPLGQATQQTTTAAVKEEVK